MGGAMLSKSWIQFSVDGWSCVCSLLFQFSSLQLVNFRWFCLQCGHLCSIPALGRSPGEGEGYPLQYSGLKNSMDCIIHGVAKSQTRVSNLHFHFQMVEVMKIMATSFKMSHVCTAILSVPNPAAGHCRPMPLPETPGHSRQVWVSLLWGHCSFLLGLGAHKVLFVPSKSLQIRNGQKGDGKSEHQHIRNQ